MGELRFVHAGLVDYEVAWERQRELHAERVADHVPDTVLLLEHTPVYTAGKRTNKWDRPTDGSRVIDVDRGGKITWHGPGQIVGYPIIKLPEPMDVVGYVRRLEEALIGVCADFGLAAIRIDGRSGVWFPATGERPERKIAAIGVRVSRGVTMHGFALNCDCDLSWFDRIIPCGIADASVTSLSLEQGRDVSVDQVKTRVVDNLRAIFDGQPLVVAQN